MATELNGQPPEERKPPFLQVQTSTHLLVTEWCTDSIFGLAGAMLAAVVASVTFECFREYLQHLRREAVIRKDGVECCGTEVMSFQEKLGQTVIHVLRASFGYFMMFCVVTMNIWLLISVVVGSAIGYGVGKPLVANHIRDSFTSHGYNTARVDIWNHGRNRSERSKSWRYQAIQSTNLSISEHGEDETSSEKQVLERKHFEKGEHSPEIIWIRRSSEDLRSQENNASEVFDETEVQLRYPDTVSSIASEERSPKSRFKSTSKVINESFRSSRSETLSSRSSVNSLVKNSHVNRSSSRASTGRFKPVSQQIMRQMSDLT